MDDLSASYRKDLMSGYYRQVNGIKCLKPEFIVEYPKYLARKLKHFQKNKLSQLWKFYDHARWVQDRMIHRGEIFEAVEADLRELSSNAHYAYNRGTVTEEFRDFIDDNLAQIKDGEDLAAFIKHFQALIAYLPRQNQR